MDQTEDNAQGAPQAADPATPSASAQDAATGPEAAPAAPSAPKADPGPPPKAPQPPAGLDHPHVARIAEITRTAASDVAQAREGIQALSMFRLPPALARYKAEALDWLDRLEAHLQALL